MSLRTVTSGPFVSTPGLVWSGLPTQAFASGENLTAAIPMGVDGEQLSGGGVQQPDSALPCCRDRPWPASDHRAKSRPGRWCSSIHDSFPWLVPARAVPALPIAMFLQTGSTRGMLRVDPSIDCLCGPTHQILTVPSQLAVAIVLPSGEKRAARSCLCGPRYRTSAVGHQASRIPREASVTVGSDARRLRIGVWPRHPCRVPELNGAGVRSRGCRAKTRLPQSELLRAFEVVQLARSPAAPAIPTTPARVVGIWAAW